MLCLTLFSAIIASSTNFLLSWMRRPPLRIEFKVLFPPGDSLCKESIESDFCVDYSKIKKGLLWWHCNLPSCLTVLNLTVLNLKFRILHSILHFFAGGCVQIFLKIQCDSEFESYSQSHWTLQISRSYTLSHEILAVVPCRSLVSVPMQQAPRPPVYGGDCCKTE